MSRRGDGVFKRGCCRGSSRQAKRCVMNRRQTYFSMSSRGGVDGQGEGTVSVCGRTCRGVGLRAVQLGKPKRLRRGNISLKSRLPPQGYGRQTAGVDWGACCCCPGGVGVVDEKWSARDCDMPGRPPRPRPSSAAWTHRGMRVAQAEETPGYSTGSAGREGFVVRREDRFEWTGGVSTFNTSAHAPS